MVAGPAAMDAALVALRLERLFALDRPVGAVGPHLVAGVGLVQHLIELLAVVHRGVGLGMGDFHAGPLRAMCSHFIGQALRPSSALSFSRTSTPSMNLEHLSQPVDRSPLHMLMGGTRHALTSRKTSASSTA